jgi:hypothetical protein
MAKHEVQLQINQGITIKHVDAEFPVWSDGTFLGRLRVSKGSVDWVPALARTAYRLRWERFAEVMVDNGRRVTVG